MIPGHCVEVLKKHHQTLWLCAAGDKSQLSFFSILHSPCLFFRTNIFSLLPEARESIGLSVYVENDSVSPLGKLNRSQE